MSTRWRTLLLFLVLGVLVLVAAACSENGSDSTLTATPTASSIARPIAVTGLITEPRETTPDAYVSLPPQPPSQFEPWDGFSTMLYDRVNGTELNLGQGDLGRFSPNGGWMGWNAGPPYEFDDSEAWVIELSTLERRSLGPGNFIRFQDDSTALIQVATGPTQYEVVNIRTGDRERVSGQPPPPTTPTPQHGLGITSAVADQRNGVRTSDGQELLTFDVFRAVVAGPEDIVVMTIPEDGNTNIFIVDIESGEATFIASSPITRIANHPFAANEDFIVWTDDYCNFDSPGQTRVYDRRDGTITELDDRLWVSFTSDGLIASGTFGAKALIDPETFEYTFVLPALAPGSEGQSSGPDVSWSPDDVYVSRGFAGGHGGLCG